MKSTARALWHGGLKDGNGQISTASGALQDVAYSFSNRFEKEGRLNPEELIAAAHASCFTMALSKQLGDAGLKPSELETTAEVTLETSNNDIAITQIHLYVRAEIYNADPNVFMNAVTTAKENCPVSKVLNANITMDAKLDSDPPAGLTDEAYATGSGAA